MTRASAISIVALGLGGAALALSLLRGPAGRSGVAPPLPAAEAPDAATAARVLARLDELERAQRALADRLAMLEAGVTTAARTPAASDLASRDELDALREELHVALGGGAPKRTFAGDEALSPEFTERVEQSMQEIRVKEAREDAARTVAWRSERLREKLPDVAQRLGLTAQQESSLEASLLTLYERRASYGVLWASGEVQEKSAFGEIEQQNMTAFMTDLGGFLTPQQLEDYLALQGDAFPGGEDGGK